MQVNSMPGTHRSNKSTSNLHNRLSSMSYTSSNYTSKVMREVPCILFKADVATVMDSSMLRRDVLMVYLHANGEDMFDSHVLCSAFSKYLNVSIISISLFWSNNVLDKCTRRGIPRLQYLQRKTE